MEEEEFLPSPANKAQRKSGDPETAEFTWKSMQLYRPFIHFIISA